MHKKSIYLESFPISKLYWKTIIFIKPNYTSIFLFSFSYTLGTCDWRRVHTRRTWGSVRIWKNQSERYIDRSEQRRGDNVCWYISLTKHFNQQTTMTFNLCFSRLCKIGHSTPSPHWQDSGKLVWFGVSVESQIILVVNEEQTCFLPPEIIVTLQEL